MPDQAEKLRKLVESEPAFPRATSFVDGKAADAQVGMSLRDYFAAAVVQGTYANARWNDESQDEIAKMAYTQADEMLAARAAKAEGRAS